MPAERLRLCVRSRQFLDCFSFGICKVRDTAVRKLKGVQMIKRVVASVQLSHG